MIKGEYRRGIFVVVYALEGERIKYVVLKRRLHWHGWEFPKGGIGEGESEEATVRREVREETGLNIKGQLKKFNIHGKYRYSKKLPDRPGFIGQSYSLYAAEVNYGKIKIDTHEHSASDWLEFHDAFNRITQKDQKGCLKIVNVYLSHGNFRKIITNTGILILAGKDEDSNEELVKQAESNEYVLHTVAAGSPFVNIKGKANEGEIKEAAIFCAKYSRDWKQHRNDIAVNIFKGKDIYKSPGMKAGTFGVKNLRTIKVKKGDIERFNLG